MQEKILGKINTAIIILFIFLVMFDPTGEIFKLKNILFIILLGIYSLKVFLKKRFINKKLLLIYLIIQLIALFSVFVGGIQNDEYTGYFLLRTYIFFICIVVIYGDEEKFLRIYSKFGILMSVLSLMIQGLLLQSMENIVLIKNIFNIFLGNSLYITLSANLQDLGIIYLGRLSKVYFSTSATLIFCLAFYINEFLKRKEKKFLIYAIVILLGLISSGTRANIITGVLVFILLLYNNNIKTFILLSVPVLIVFYLNIKKIMAMFLRKDASNNIKLNYLSSYVKIFENIGILLWGQGIGSINKFNGELIKRTELSYFEIYREFGIIFGSLFIIILFYPIIKYFTNNKKYKNDNYLIIPYILFLLQNIVNPVLLNSQGILLVSIIFGYSMRYNEKIDESKMIRR